MGSSDRPPLGESETRILLWITQRGSVSAREVAAHFQEAEGLARTTVLTVLDRLRGKGYLQRVKEGSSFRYAATEAEETVSDVVEGFVQRSLGGSVTPLVAYLANAESLTREEIDALSKLVQDLKSESDKSERDGEGSNA